MRVPWEAGETGHEACKNSAGVALDALNSEIDPPLVYDPGLEVAAAAGKLTYRVFVAGRYEGHGMWAGWVEFYPSDPELEPLRTDRETTQTSYARLLAWAESLDQSFVEAAFGRGHAWPPERGAEVIHEHTPRIADAEGNVYLARTCASRRDDGQWVGWLEFEPSDASRPPLRTGRETTQSNRESIAYWASGLEPVYLEGALRRARY